jgi:hypothetical protein
VLQLIEQLAPSGGLVALIALGLVLVASVVAIAVIRSFDKIKIKVGGLIAVEAERHARKDDGSDQSK